MKMFALTLALVAGSFFMSPEKTDAIPDPGWAKFYATPAKVTLVGEYLVFCDLEMEAWGNSTPFKDWGDFICDFE